MQPTKQKEAHIAKLISTTTNYEVTIQNQPSYHRSTPNRKSHATSSNLLVVRDYKVIFSQPRSPPSPTSHSAMTATSVVDTTPHHQKPE